MLILPQGHTETVQRPHPLRKREKAMIGGVLGLLAALAIALVISFASSGHKSGHGCISVSLAYSVGGTQTYRCGASAREMCARVNQPGGTVGAAAQALTSACRKAGLPVG
jgi:hypothetical protein